MNSKRYRLIFSKRLKALIAVAECCLSAGKAVGESSFVQSIPKSQYTRFIGALSFAYLSVCSAYGAPAVDALPQGGVVAQGAASIQQTNNLMNITQSTDKAVVNWQSFDIGSAARLNVLQPNATSVLLNRVLGNNPSQIFGSLTANGEVILINPNGILFGRDGSVNASAFTASTLDIKDSDFMSGNYRYFRAGGSGEIINQGSINTRGYVALLGAKVTNDGLISTQGGNVMLGAGEAVALPVTNSGRIRMELTPASINAAIENTQQGVIVTQGGQVLVQASAINDAVASVVQAGAIDTRGAQGGNITVLADSNIRVSGSINANSLDAIKEGGRIIVGRDEVTGELTKSTDVSGASFTTNKGFVETSGDVLKADGVNVQAADWLLDPYNITITNSSSGTTYSDPNTGSYTYTPSATSSILATDIQNSLNNGTNVKISTGLSGSAGANAGNITVASSITKSSGGAATLTLEANNSITLNSGVSISDSGMTTRNLGVKLTANAASGTSISKALFLAANAIIDVGGSVNVDVAKSVGGGLNASAIFLTLGSLDSAQSNGLTRTLIRGGDVTINMALSGTDTFGLFGEHATGIEAKNGNLNITATYSGSGSSSGTAVSMGSGWNGTYFPAPSILKATNGAINVQSITSGTSANGSLVFSGTSISATNDINLKAQLSDATQTAISLGQEFNAPKINSSAGNVLLQSNVGAIRLSNLTAAAITGQNITIDNTGSNLVRDAHGNYTKGAGTYTGTSGSSVLLSGSGSGTQIQASLNLDVMGVGSASGSSGVVQTGTNISGSRVSIQGENLGTGSGTTNGFYNTGTITSTTSDVYIRGVSQKDNALSLQGAITGKTDINLTAQAGDASNMASSWGLYLNKAVTAQTGNINVTATTTSGSSVAANFASGASLVTSGTGKNITVAADTLDIHTSAASINAGSSGTVNILQVTNGVAIDLGGSDVMTSGSNVLGLSNAELGRVTAGQLNIGNSSSGNITVSSAVTTADAAGNLALTTGGNLAINAALQTGATGTKNLSLNLTGSGSATQTAALKANNLELMGTNASYTLNNTANYVTTLAANLKNLSYINANTLTIGSVNSTTGINTSGNISITATTTSGNALTISQAITSTNGNVSLTATTADTGTTKAAVFSAATVSGNHITLNATANGNTGKTLGYWGSASAKFITTNGNLNLTGSSANDGDGFYMYGGLLQATGSITVSGTSNSYVGIKFDSAGTNSNASVTAGNGISMTGNLIGASVNASTTNGIDLNGVNMTNSAGAVILTATKGSINAIAGSSITQNSSGDVTLTTVGDGNITVPKIINNGTGNVIIAAGSDLLAGTGIGGQVLTVAGNTVTNNNNGKTYVYSGGASGTGLLTNLDNSFSTLSLSGDTGTSLQPILQNADSDVQYMTNSNRNTIVNGAQAQVLFREKISVDLSNNAISGATLTKIYGSVNTTSSDAVALLGEMRAQLKQANSGTIVKASNGNSFAISKSTVIDDLSGSLQSAQYSTSGHLNSNLYSYGILVGTKYATTLAAGQAQMNISKATASVSGTVTNVTYNRLTQNQSAATSSGFVSGDAITISGAVSGKNAGTYTSALSVGGADAGNYDVSITNADLIIAKKEVTLTAGSVTKTYDASLTYSTTQADLDALSNQLISGDTVSAATIAYTDKNYGIGNKAVTLNSVTLSDGNNGNNYLLTLAGNSTSTINRATLTASLTGAVEKVYDGTNVLSGLSLMTSGVISGDNVTAIGSGIFHGVNVSSSVSFTVSSFAMRGADSGNYSLSTSSLTGTGSITPKTLTILGGSAQDKVFDNTANVVYSPGTLSGVVTGESLTLSSSAAFADSIIGNNKNVLVTYNVTDGVGGGGLASNYTFSGNTSVRSLNTILHASIKSKPVAVDTKPFINPVNTAKPAQPLISDVQTHISVSSNSLTQVSSPSSTTSAGASASTSTNSASPTSVKVSAAPQAQQVNSVIDCVQTSMTGVTLCFATAD